MKAFKFKIINPPKKITAKFESWLVICCELYNASPEYLVAIMLDTGRLKDFLRINVFLEHGAVNREDLQIVLEKHNLAEKWRQNIGRFQI